MFEGELFVACAAPRQARHNMLFPQRNSGESLAVGSTHADLRDRARALCDDVLMRAAPIPEERISVREGDVVSVAVAEARATAAAIVVLGACGDGATATDGPVAPGSRSSWAGARGPARSSPRPTSPTPAFRS